MQEWRGVRDAVIKDRRSNRDDGKIGSRKRHNQSATTASGIDA
jgi:hypothetical protein